MTTIDALVQELEQEAQLSRRTLERVPEHQLAWAPHERSMTLGQLASHVATLPAVVMDLAGQASFEVTTRSAELRRSGGSAESVSGLLELLDQSVRRASAALAAMDDGALATPWRMVRGATEVGAIPRGALIRSVLFSHWAHHRGQLTVYLRLVGAAVPALYGDSADEPDGPM